MLILIEGFTNEKKNNIIENFQILVSENSIYLINSTVNYGKYVKSIFSGIGEIMGLFGDTVGIIGELTIEITGSKLAKILKEYSDRSNDKKLEKLKKNLDKIATKKKGILKIDFTDLDMVKIKKGYVVNGKSYAEFNSTGLNIRLYSSQRENVTKLTNALKSKNSDIKVKSILI